MILLGLLGQFSYGIFSSTFVFVLFNGVQANDFVLRMQSSTAHKVYSEMHLSRLKNGIFAGWQLSTLGFQQF